ncbi:MULTISPECIES: AAA family ATPase [unclassified Yersinia (in: enterobacteria)]|uniref:AAA family ATPase n=1 Tax=unclassified Yersinia (in: enterobacteria) TaxID=2653513 RepID=UPI002263B816|nr:MULTISPECIES: AAA family ATPase [unclassified Yersinia (in: enterobacteria)]
MIVGLIIRNFKTFKNQHYIPISLDGRLSWFIGENGVGKSTILCALDALLNNSDINKLDVNNEVRSQGYDTREPFIVPIFLIDKEKIKGTSSVSKTLEIISNITWQIESEDFKLLQRPIAEKFVAHRGKLSKYYNDKTHYLIPLGFTKERPSDMPIPYMSFFGSIDDYEEQLESSFEPTNTSWQKKYNHKDTLSKTLQSIKELYNYIYLPAEITVDSYSKLEGELLQSLLGEDIQQKISKVIKKSDITEINRYLNTFIEDVSKILDGNYQFKKPSQRQSQFTQRHMIIKIIESYFSDKVLHFRDGNKKEVPAYNLSSGEKRRALLDLATAFLKANPKKAQLQTIFAIDEPELSLHATACFKQFEKIRHISELGVQTLVTTHWYGFLPVVGDGTAVYISPNQTHISPLNLKYFREESIRLVTESNGSYLDTLEVKSNYDLVQSIISSITSGNSYNWLICEGRTDKKYLQAHLKNENISNLIVLPVSGCIVLKKIFNYLLLALEDRKKTISGKVYCLMDTDIQYDKFDANDSIPKITLRRILYDGDANKIHLVKASDSKVSPATEIEDTLDALLFARTLIKLKNENEIDFDFIKKGMEYYPGPSFNAFEITPTQKKKIADFFSRPGMKDVFCDTYISLLENANDDPDISTPEWLKEIIQFFKK